ncbi:MAG: outer membrane beta-barrel protein [Paludibacteraceae bacterium]|nr:outer membrane beta-barrel protein [Paludibacteraceae bacterium]
MRKIYTVAILSLVAFQAFAFSFEPSTNPWFGFTVGYVSSQIKISDGTETETYGLLGEHKLSKEEREYYKEMKKEGYKVDIPDRNYSTGLQVGLTFNPEFVYGIGLKTGLLYECAIYQNSTSYSKKGISLKTSEISSDHAISIPLQISWRVEVYDELSLFLYTGPVFDIHLGQYSHSSESGKYEGEKYSMDTYTKGAPYSKTYYTKTVVKYDGDKDDSGWEDFENEPILTRFNVAWAVGAGIQWKGLRLTVGGQFGMNNLVLPDFRDDDYSIRANKPFEISLSYMFLDRK